MVDKVESVIAAIERSIPEEGVRVTIVERLRAQFDKPPAEEMALLLRRGVSVAKARELLFTPSPDEDGIGVYPVFLRSPAGELPDGHPVAAAGRKVQVTALGLLYLHHLHDWRLAKAFCCHGGLLALSALLEDVNPMLRSQAIDCVLQVTSNGAYDWFLPAGGEDDKALHAALLHLGRGRTCFLAALLNNWESNAPGSSYACLQILAFWLSWARRLYSGVSPDGNPTMKLSAHMLQRLKDWAERPVGDMHFDAPEVQLQKAGGGAGSAAPRVYYSSTEEQELAKRLYDDFARFGAAEPEAQAGSDAAAVKGLDTAALPAPPNAVTPTSAAAAAPAPPPSTAAPAAAEPDDVLSQATKLKDSGNAAFVKTEYVEAVGIYTKGVALLAPRLLRASSSSSSSTAITVVADAPAAEKAALVTLLSNRAAALLRSAGYGNALLPPAAFLARTSALVKAHHPQLAAANAAVANTAAAAAAADAQLPAPLAQLVQAIADCDVALSVDASHPKCLFRKAQGLAGLSRLPDALAVARACLAACMLAASSTSSSKDKGKSEQRERDAAAEMLPQVRTFLTHLTALQAQGALQAGADDEDEGDRDGDEAQTTTTTAATSRTSTTAAAPTAGADDEVDEEEQEEEDEILAQLLGRAEFGGSGTSSNSSSSIAPVAAVVSSRVTDLDSLDDAVPALAAAAAVQAAAPVLPSVTPVAVAAAADRMDFDALLAGAVHHHGSGSSSSAGGGGKRKAGGASKGRSVPDYLQSIGSGGNSLDDLLVE